MNIPDNSSPNTGHVADWWARLVERVSTGKPDYLPTPWPDLAPVAHLAYTNRVALVAQRGAHEAGAGRRIAAHAAETMPVLLFSAYPPGNAPAGLVVDETPDLTPDRVQAAVDRMRYRGNAPGLVVIDRFERMRLEDREDCTRVEELEDVGLRLLHGERGCPLLLTTVTDDEPDLRRRIVHWAGVDSPAAILLDYSSRVVVLRRRDDGVVEACVEGDECVHPADVNEIPWPLPPGARRTSRRLPAPAPLEHVAPAGAPVVSGAVRALETEYAGHRFRSRLEARWAVAFDALGVPWDYELERYQLPSGKYLPDFWLPAQKVFFEVKGTAPSGSYRGLLEELAVGTGCRVVLAVGSIPDPARYRAGEEESGAGFWMGAFSPGGEWDSYQGWVRCSACGCLDVVHGAIPRFAGCGCKAGAYDYGQEADPAVLGAFRAARSARFEHGESGV